MMSVLKYQKIWHLFEKCLVPHFPVTRDLFNLDGLVYLSLCTIFNPIFIWLLNLKYKYIVTALWILRFVNYRMRKGSQGNAFCKKNILITGASGGLGWEIVKQLRDKAGVDQIIIVDIKEPKFAFENVTYINHDLGSAKPEDLICKIERQIPIGEINIVICNAGMRQPTEMLDMESAKLESIINVNWINQLKLIQYILGERLKSKKHTHVIGICSILAFLAPRNLGVYSATKAALLMSLDSMRQEAYKNYITVSTILPGQLDSTMFSDLDLNWFLAPVIESRKLAIRIVEIIDNNWNGEFTFPIYGRFLPIIKASPFMVQIFARWFGNVDQ